MALDVHGQLYKFISHASGLRLHVPAGSLGLLMIRLPLLMSVSPLAVAQQSLLASSSMFFRWSSSQFLLLSGIRRSCVLVGLMQGFFLLPCQMTPGLASVVCQELSRLLFPPMRLQGRTLDARGSSAI